jgi:hypothetical protein
VIKKSEIYKSKKKKAIKMLKSYKGKETSIERKIREYLDSVGIPYIQEYGIKHKIKTRKLEVYRVYDFLIEGVNKEGKPFKFLCECDGSYFHSSDYLEGKVPLSKLTKLQKSNLRNDKLKDKIAKEKGIPLLRFKEKDIKWDFGKIIDLIDREINYN